MISESNVNYIQSLARRVLMAFIFTFTAARVLVFLIMDNRIPDFYLYVGSTHVHHLNYGIFILSILGGYLIFAQPAFEVRKIMAILYGIGLALTFDEFGMWLHLGGGYWQRASFDAITVIAAILILLSFTPSFKYWRVGHYFSGFTVIFISVIFFIMLLRSLEHIESRIIPKMQKLEAGSVRK